MRVVYLNPSGQLGGADRILLDALASLREAEPTWDLQLVTSAEGPLVSRASALGVGTTVVAFPPALARLGDAATGDPFDRQISQLALLGRLVTANTAVVSYLLRLRKELRRLQPDVLHTNGFKMHILGLWARPAGVPVVWHIHDFVSARRVMSRVMRLHSWGCASAVACSRSVARDVEVTCRMSESVYPVYNAVNLQDFSPEGPVLDLDRLSGLPPPEAGVIRVGLLATLARWKGHETFLEALARLPPELPVRGYIVSGAIYQTDGSQYTLDELRGVAARLGLEGRVGFTGFVNEPAAAIRALDVVVHASTRPEPFGLVIAEAMACGRAVIVSNSGGAGEIIHDGLDALGHVPGDADGLARLISRLVGDAPLRGRLGQQARETVGKRFDRARLAEELIPVYQRVVAAASAPQRGVRRFRPAWRRTDAQRPNLPTWVPPVSEGGVQRDRHSVVYLNPSGQLGGAERVLLDLLASVREAEPNWTLHLVMAEDGPLADRALRLGVGVTLMPFAPAIARLGDAGGWLDSGLGFRALIGKIFSATAAIFGYTKALRGVLADLGPDVIHSNGFKMHVLGLWARPRGVPVVWHLHEHVSHRRIMSGLLRVHAGACDMAITNSISVAGDLRSVCGRRLQVRTVYNAIDLEVFAPEGEALDLDAASGLPPSDGATVRVGLVGTLGMWKGHAVFLNALSLLPPELRVRGYVIGEALYRTDGSQHSLEELKSLADRLGIRERLGFTGFIDEPATAMRALDIVVHSSIQPEGFGLVIVEAMACGRPVIVSRAGGAAEIINPGVDALAHIPGDAGDLAGLIESLATDVALRERLGRAGIATAQQRFDRSRLAREVVPIYRSVIRPGRAAGGSS